MLRFAAIVLLLLASTGCESAFARRVREIAPGIRAEVGAMRGVLPRARVEVIAPGELAEIVLGRPLADGELLGVDAV